MVLLVLIGAVWLSVAALVVAICRMAARGDAMPAPLAEHLPASRTAGAARTNVAHRGRVRPPARLAAHGGRVHNMG
jgi:hypothetical protein